MKLLDRFQECSKLTQCQFGPMTAVRVIATMLDFTRINTAALANAEAIVRRIIPGGALQGREYVALNPKRADTKPGSFKVNLHTGRWADFATGEAGGDLISLTAWRYGVRQVEAARSLASFLCIGAEVSR